MDGGDVCAYLDTHKIEAEITAAVAACVEQGAAQPLAYLARRLAERAAEVALEFDYKSLCAELKALVRSHTCAKELVRCYAFVFKERGLTVLLLLLVRD